MASLSGLSQRAEKLASSTVCPQTKSIWIFGYGSLMYRPGFEHARTVQGYVKHFKRVWHQGSTDHRGTPEFPGRTVTLDKCAGEITWGVAYELAGDQAQQEQTLKYLEWREKQYDVRELVTVHGLPGQLQSNQLGTQELLKPSSNSLHNSADNASQRGISATGSGPINGQNGAFKLDECQLLLENVLCYVASPDTSRNTNYLGPASLPALAAQIAIAVGPSGPNWEYLARLAASLRQMGVDDGELFELEAAVMEKRRAQGLASDVAQALAGIHVGGDADGRASHSADSFPLDDWVGAVEVVAGTGMSY